MVNDFRRVDGYCDGLTIGDPIAGGRRISPSFGEPEPMRDLLKNVCRIHTDFMVHRYLMANAHGCWDGAEKALRHRELCQFYTAMYRGVPIDSVTSLDKPFKAVHQATKVLTDHMDEAIGFPLDRRPDYDTLAPLFFERFHTLAMEALSQF